MLYHNTSLQPMITNKKTGRFSSKDKSWRMRKDLVEVLKNNTEEPASFSASMARKYACAYIFAMYFENRKEKAWINSVLELFGWSKGYDEAPYRMAVYNILRTLRSDFNMEIELVKAQENERCGKGQSYYVFKDFGLFNPTPLFKMLYLNREVFENIIKEDFSKTIKKSKKIENEDNDN